MEVTDVISFGRRVREMSIMPASAAWAARKRKSIECAFSELRAMMEICGGYYLVWCGVVREVCAGLRGWVAIVWCVAL